MFVRCGLLLAFSCAACGPQREAERSVADGTGGSTDDPAVDSTMGQPSDGTTAWTTDADSSDGSAPSTGFIGAFDFGGTCHVASAGTLLSCECNLWAQDCPDGRKCVPWANDESDVWNSTRCAPLDPAPDPVGAPCTVEGSPTSGVDSCEMSSMCWNVDPDTLEGTCVGFCSGHPEAPTCNAPHHTCMSANGVLILCLPECHPLVDDCGEGFACRPKEPSGVEPTGFVCLPTDAGGQVLDGCEAMGGCPAGHACVGSNVIESCAAGCCAPYCDRDDPLADAACGERVEGNVCHALMNEATAPPSHAHVGVCGAP